MFNLVEHRFQYGDEEVVLQTGKVARQAHSSVVVSKGTKSILCTIAVGSAPKEGNFLPLHVIFQEKYYSSGKFPGGFFKREARPSDKSTLTARLIDRPIRPMFASNFRHEVQIVCTTLSTDSCENLELLGMIATSAALAISGLPVSGVMGAAKLGYSKSDDTFKLNPSYEYLEQSDLDLIVAGTSDSILMVESEVNELSEEKMLEALSFGVDSYQTVIQNIEIFRDKVGNKHAGFPVQENKVEWFEQKIADKFTDQIKSAYEVKEKQVRVQKIAELLKEVQGNLQESESSEFDDRSIVDCSDAFHKLEKKIVRNNLLNGQPRIDGRGLDDIRDISVEVDLFQNVHGSSLFTRGETQALVFTTLGTQRDYQLNDSIDASGKDYFLFHYNFPPYSVGEVGMMGSPKRRELGHGNLAKRGISAVVPTFEEFPYSIRVVSEITESNGSSSMASVCGASLSLMAAGVPLKKSVAGIAMGLVLEQESFCVLTDILGDEDHLGDMDFKVAGSVDGITALQMDIKISGISQDIMREALTKARVARLSILEKMDAVIDKTRDDLPSSVPKTKKLSVPKEKIRDIIGKGGSVIQKMSADYECDIEVTDEGIVSLYGKDPEKLEEVEKVIIDLVSNVEVGQIFTGKVTKVIDTGAFVNLKKGVDGYLHLSQISNEYVKDIKEHIQMDDEVTVKVIAVDERGRIRLTKKGF